MKILKTNGVEKPRLCQQNGELFADERNCRKYYKCAQENIQLLKCNFPMTRSVCKVRKWKNFDAIYVEYFKRIQISGIWSQLSLWYNFAKYPGQDYRGYLVSSWMFDCQGRPSHQDCPGSLIFHRGLKAPNHA